MTDPQKKVTAEKLALQITGLCMTSHSITPMVDLISKALTLAAQEAREEHNSSSGKCQLCHDAWKLGYASGAEAMRERAAKEAEKQLDYCSAHRSEVDQCIGEIVERIRALSLTEKTK